MKSGGKHEILKDRHEMKKKWSRPWIYSERNEKIFSKQGVNGVELLNSTPLPTDYGDWTYLVFGDYTTGREQTMMIYGDFKRGSIGDGRGVIVRIHSACATSEVFHSNNCECREELIEAMKRIKRAGRGIIVYLYQEGGGNGLSAKAAAYNNTFFWKNGKIRSKNISVYDSFRELKYKNENRSFTAAAEMLRQVGVKSVRLLTNNPKKIEGLKKYGFDVKPAGIHIKPKNTVIANHLRAKAKLLKHHIDKKDWATK